MTLMRELVVWLVRPFTNGPYGCFGVLDGTGLAIGLMQMPSWIWWRRVGQCTCGVDGGIGRLVGRAVHERPYRFFCVLGGLVLAIGLMQMPSWIWWRRVGQWMCGVDGGIGRLVGRAVHERPLPVFLCSGRFGVGDRFDADAELDMVASCRSMDLWR